MVKNAGISTDIINENSISVLGGIVGKNQGRVINCSFDGEIEGDAIVGGIVGQNERTDTLKRVIMSVLFWETKTPAELSERITAGSSHPRIPAK
ncbi:MAG: GLUG motif-containing protein [Monoglobus pectinilyticus]